MNDDVNAQIAQLRSEIVSLESVISTLAAVPDTQRQIEAQLAERRTRLSKLLHPRVAQQTYLGPTVNGSLTSEHDTYVATIQNFFGQSASEDGEALLKHYLRALLEDTQSLRLPRISNLSPSEATQILLPPLELTDVFTNLATDGPPKIVESYSGSAADVRVRLAKFTADSVDPETVAPENVRTRIITLQDQKLPKKGLQREQSDLNKLSDDVFVQVDLVRPELVVEAIAGVPRLVLLGAPGSGKSTVLRYLASLLARHLLNPGELLPPGWDAAPVPILCPLGLIADDLTAVKPGQEVAIFWQMLEAQLDGGGVREGLGRYLRPALNRGGAILLLDGLDELSTMPSTNGRSPRTRASTALQAMIKALPQSTQVVLTSRIQPYEQVPETLRGDWRLPADIWTVRRIQPLAFGQVRHFITNWYARACHKAESHYTPEEGTTRAQALIEKIKVNNLLYELISSPLLLTTVALLHYNKTTGETPRDRARPYDESVQQLLDRWEPMRTPEWARPNLLERMGIADIASADDLRKVLHIVALQAQNRPPALSDGRGLLRGSELEGELSRFLRRELRCDRVEEKLTAFELALHDGAGLLQKLDDDSYGFPYLTFQKFLAACALVDSAEFTSKAYQLWSGNANLHWRQVILLVADRLNQIQQVELLGMNLVRILLNSQTLQGVPKDASQHQRDALLAADCYGQWAGRMALPKYELDEIEHWEQRIAKALTLVLKKEPLAPIADRLRAGYYLGSLIDPRPGVAESKLDWCDIPAGIFLMGSSDDDKEAKNDEKPLHNVNLLAYRISRYPITNGQWRKFIEAGGYNSRQWWSDDGWQIKEQNSWFQPRFWNDDRFNGKNQPVVGISWYEATAFCNWLTKEGHEEEWLSKYERIRLPSEAEWEKAARGADGRIYPWGNEWETAKANSIESGIGATTPVGCYPDAASPYDVLDICGNVWEWTSTPYSNDYSQDDGSSIELSSGKVFVLRGGSWAQDKQLSRCAFRNTLLSTDEGARNLGMRVAAVPAHAKPDVPKPVLDNFRRVMLVFTPENRDYRVLLIDGSATSLSLNLRLTEDSLAELLATTRAGLEAIIDTRQGAIKIYQQPVAKILENVAQRSLSELAQLGADLRRKLFSGGSDAQVLSERLRGLSQTRSLAITVTADRFPFPWQLLYDRDPRDGVDINGFWGFRHILTAQPTSWRSISTGDSSLGLAQKLRALTAYNLRLDQAVPGRSLVAEQRQTLNELDVAAQEAVSEAALEAALAAGTDAEILYFYCHMLSQSPTAPAAPGGPAGVAGTRIILTEAKNGLTLHRLEQSAPLGPTPLLPSGPLVVLNACGSVDLSPLTYDGLAPYLLDQGARAIIGTAANTPISFGAAFGPALLRAIIADRQPVGEALLRVRREFWEQHRNPLGLLYTLYGNADLRVDSPSIDGV